jgi:hypothetical protein
VTLSLIQTRKNRQGENTEGGRGAEERGGGGVVEGREGGRADRSLLYLAHFLY